MNESILTTASTSSTGAAGTIASVSSRLKVTWRPDVIEKPSYTEHSFQHGIHFRAKYIGSVVINRPNIRAEVVAAMRRVRYECKALKVPKTPVVITVSIDGIRVTREKNSKTGTNPGKDDPVVFSHTIQTIYCVQHDSRDMKIFSHLTKDQKYGYECHVFKCDKTAKSLCIVQTIGQAFEMYRAMSDRYEVENGPEWKFDRFGMVWNPRSSIAAPDLMTMSDLEGKTSQLGSRVSSMLNRAGKKASSSILLRKQTGAQQSPKSSRATRSDPTKSPVIFPFASVQAAVKGGPQPEQSRRSQSQVPAEEKSPSTPRAPPRKKKGTPPPWERQETTEEVEAEAVETNDVPSTSYAPPQVTSALKVGVVKPQDPGRGAQLYAEQQPEIGKEEVPAGGSTLPTGAPGVAPQQMFRGAPPWPYFYPPPFMNPMILSSMAASYYGNFQQPAQPIVCPCHFAHHTAHQQQHLLAPTTIVNPMASLSLSPASSSSIQSSSSTSPSSGGIAPIFQAGNIGFLDHAPLSPHIHHKETVVKRPEDDELAGKIRELRQEISRLESSIDAKTAERSKSHSRRQAQQQSVPQPAPPVEPMEKIKLDSPVGLSRKKTSTVRNIDTAKKKLEIMASNAELFERLIHEIRPDAKSLEVPLMRARANSIGGLSESGSPIIVGRPLKAIADGRIKHHAKNSIDSGVHSGNGRHNSVACKPEDS